MVSTRATAALPRRYGGLTVASVRQMIKPMTEPNQLPSGPTRVTRLEESLMRDPRRVVLAALILGLASAIALIVLGFVVSSEALEIGPELMKAGVQVGAVTLVGAGIGYMLRIAEESRAQERQAEVTKNARAQEEEAKKRLSERESEVARLEDERRRAEYRYHVFQDVVTAYNGVKSARRILRARGFRRTAGDRAMSAEDAAEFNVRTQALTESQLMFESVLRQVRARPGWFTTPDVLIALLGTVETYVGEVIDDWERTDGDVVAGARLGRIHSLTHLQDFLDVTDLGFESGASEPMREIEETLREDAYPTPISRA